jgi:hypothetical protein
MAGPNDHHIDKNGEIQPGLGRDEPSEIAKLAAKDAGSAATKALKAELQKQAGELSAREREVLAQQEALARAAKDLEAQQNDIARRESELAAREGGTRRGHRTGSGHSQRQGR